MNEYIPGDFLKKSVENKDAYAVRGAIVAIILSDPSFKKGDVDAAISYAMKNGISVYEEHDDSYTMEQDTTKWNKDTFAEETSFLQRNFSKERFANIKLMGQKVYARSIEKPKSNSNTNYNYSERNYTTKQRTTQDFTKGRRLMIAAAVGIVAATVIIIALKK